MYRLSNILEPAAIANKEQKDVRFTSPPRCNKENRASILGAVNTPNRQLLQSVEKSAQKDILMKYWLSKGTPQKSTDRSTLKLDF